MIGQQVLDLAGEDVLAAGDDHVVVAALDESQIDTLVVIGGEGTLEIGMRFAKMGVNVVGIPKAIDNDLATGSLDAAWQTDLVFRDTRGTIHDPAVVALTEVTGGTVEGMRIPLKHAAVRQALEQEGPWMVSDPISRNTFSQAAMKAK